MFQRICRGHVLRAAHTQPYSCYRYGMSSDEFRKRAKMMVDFICEYNRKIACQPLIPNVKPGFLKKAFPKEAPVKPDEWDCILKDTFEHILPAMVPWQHPKFYGYHPTGNSYASMLGNWISGLTGANGFEWEACPAQTELELVVTDWYAKAISIPQFYLHEYGRGGGVFNNTTTDGLFTAMLAARHSAIKKLKKCNEDIEDSCLLPKLVAYYSKEAHTCVEKACNLCLVEKRALDSDDHCRLRGAALEQAMQCDVEKGLVPFFVVATLGTPGVFSCDNLAEIGPVTCRYCAWLHVDASYAGSAFICPEFRPLMAGIEYSSSFTTSPHQWLLTHHDCSLLYVKERKKLLDLLLIQAPYLQNPEPYLDLRNWSIALSRRFRSLKLWFVLRDFGTEGLQAYIWNHCCLAKFFEDLVKKDCKFEVVNDVWFGMVCFRLRGQSCEVNEKLLHAINNSCQLFLTAAMVKCKYVIRFCISYQYATQEDVCAAWEIIQKHANEVLQKEKPGSSQATCAPSPCPPPPCSCPAQSKCPNPDPVCDTPKCPQSKCPN